MNIGFYHLTSLYYISNPLDTVKFISLHEKHCFLWFIVFSSATLPEGFCDVHQCFHIPLCDAERRCSEPVLCCAGKQAAYLSRLQPQHNTNS